MPARCGIDRLPYVHAEAAPVPETICRVAAHGPTLAADLLVYFAHTHSWCERGADGNANGLIREYHPKGTEIAGDLEPANVKGYGS